MASFVCTRNSCPQVCLIYLHHLPTRSLCRTTVFRPLSRNAEYGLCFSQTISSLAMKDPSFGLFKRLVFPLALTVLAAAWRGGTLPACRSSALNMSSSSNER